MGKRLTAALLCAFLILIPSCSLETFLGNLGNNVLGSPGEYTDAVAGKADSAGSAMLEEAAPELKDLVSDVSGVDKVLPTLKDGEKTELVADIVNATRNPEGKNAFTSAMSQPVEDADTFVGAKGTATLIKEVFEKFDTSAPLTLTHPTMRWKSITLDRYAMRKLLVPVFLGGKQVYTSPGLMQSAEYARAEKASFWDEYMRNVSPEIYKVDLSDGLYELKSRLIEEHTGVKI